MISMVILLACRQVLEVVAGVKGMDVLQLAQQVFINTCNLFKF